jgi:hypothetical protein
MSIKSKVFAAAATLTLVGGVSAVGALTAGTAGADGCGASCAEIFSRNFGTSPNPEFALDVLRQGDEIGQPIILFRPSSSDPAEHFSISDQGLVSVFHTDGLVSSALALHYGGLGCEDYDTGTATCTTPYPDDEAIEVEYSPYGVDSGLCMGTATTAVNGTYVSLQPCGATAKTTWIVDSANQIEVYVPLINGSGTSFSHPAVLTYPQNSYPTGTPRPQLVTQALEIDSHGVVNNNQEWGAISLG